MTIPPEINSIVESLNQELDEIEQIAMKIYHQKWGKF
jgi:hypothetical protein